MVERLKRWRALSVLRGRVKNSPSASAFAELAERLIALREHDEALGAAEAGLALYPDSDRLAHIRLYVMKDRKSAEIRRLRDDLRRRPHPAAYTQLAQIHRELGSDDDALAAAAECAERFPLHEGAFLVQGEIRLCRFRHDLIARDAVIAESAFRQVLRLNSQNAAAHAQLAELYWLVGLMPACGAHLAEALLLAPGSPGLEEVAAEIERRPAQAALRESLEELAAGVQERRAFANDAARFPRAGVGRTPVRASVDAARAAAAIEVLGTRAGLRNAAMFAEGGEPVAAFRSGDGLAAAAFGELVCGIRSAADDASRRMDTGSLLRTEIESPAGNVLVASTRGFTVALFYGAPLGSADALALVKDFTERELGAERVSEAARA